ncbi:hypothetical protein HCN44_004225 [Aphidius gifuensis]|uniref:Uncharacterized protein n=1 Tax=Aphidius gifuensis TaxID=684658 RepID=A0A834XWF1_APHGI|nr:uncharacterized protein LOC122848485 [Aphidius gifuensis]KAF7994753.1 hypothetical protein HCN44_004225 [Aphidius gifuensis]
MSWFSKISLKLRKRNSSKKAFFKNLLNKLKKDENLLIKCRADLEFKIQQEMLYIKKIEYYDYEKIDAAMIRKELMEKQLERIDEALAKVKCKIEIYEKSLEAFKCLKKKKYMSIDNVKNEFSIILSKSRFFDTLKQDDDDDDDDELEQELAQLMGFSKSSDTIVESSQINYKKRRAPQPIIT